MQSLLLLILKSLLEIGIRLEFGVGIADGNITGIGFGIIAKLAGIGLKKSSGIGFGIVEGGFTPRLLTCSCIND